MIEPYIQVFFHTMDSFTYYTKTLFLKQITVVGFMFYTEPTLNKQYYVT